MFSHTRNAFDRRPPGNPDTAGFLAALGDSEAAAAYRKAMGEEARPPTTDAQEPQLTTEELARLQAAQADLRETREKKLRADYLAWAREFNLGDDDPQAWIDSTFIFNHDGTVETEGKLDLSNKNLTRLPRGLTRVNGGLNLERNRLTTPEGLPKEIYGGLYLTYNDLTSLDGLPQEIHGGLHLFGNRLTSLEGLPSEIHGFLNLANNRITSLEGLPSEIHGYLDLGHNQLTSLEGLRGKRIDGDLHLHGNPATSIPPRVGGEISPNDGIELGGKVRVVAAQTVLKEDALRKGYTVITL